MQHIHCLNRAPGTAFASDASLTIPDDGGPHTLTVCFAQASWVNFFGLKLVLDTVNVPVAGTPYEGKPQTVPGFVRPER
jgi:hypothetical protein